MLVLLQADGMERWGWAIWMILSAVALAAILIIVIGSAKAIFWTVKSGFSNVNRLITHFLVVWAALSAVIWMFKGSEVIYGWAAVAAGIIGLTSAAVVSLDD